MKVFLSYSREDEPYARRLQEDLRERGVDVFSDMSIMPGARWQTALRRMIDDTDLFLLITSKASAESKSVDREVVAAVIRASRDRSVRIVPVVLDQRAKLSPLLSQYQYIGPEVASDPERVADLVQESLGEPVVPPDLNLEREILEAERASLTLEAAARYSAINKSWSTLARVLGIAGLIAGFAATALVTIWTNLGSQATAVAITLTSVLSSTFAGAVIVFSWRSRNDK